MPNSPRTRLHILGISSSRDCDLLQSPGIMGMTAGKLPGSVRTRYDWLGTYIHGRLQYTYLITATYKRPTAFGRQGPEVHTEERAARRQTHEVRSEGPSGAAASPSSHPDQFFPNQINSLKGNRLGQSPLREFCGTLFASSCPDATRRTVAGRRVY